MLDILTVVGIEMKIDIDLALFTLSLFLLSVKNIHSIITLQLDRHVCSSSLSM